MRAAEVHQVVEGIIVEKDGQVGAMRSQSRLDNELFVLAQRKAFRTRRRDDRSAGEFERADRPADVRFPSSPV